MLKTFLHVLNVFLHLNAIIRFLYIYIIETTNIKFAMKISTVADIRDLQHPEQLIQIFIRDNIGTGGIVATPILTTKIILPIFEAECFYDSLIEGGGGGSDYSVPSSQPKSLHRSYRQILKKG